MGTGELYPVVEWIPAATRVQFAHWTFSLVRLLRIVVRLKREIIVFSSVEFNFIWFFGSSYVGSITFV